jgi:elongation factor G
MEKVLWKLPGKQGRVFVHEPISPGDAMFDESCCERTKLIESLADIDDTLADLVLADTDILQIPSDILQNAIRTATLKKHFTPILCGSALKNKGIQPLLDAVISYLPSPLDIHHDFVQFYTNKLCALAFKIIHDKQRGALTFARIYSGQMKSGATLFNVNRSCQEKIGRLVEVYADEYSDVNEADVGNIVAISGLKEV